MQLTLTYNEHATQALSGAFIRGNTPDIWLQEINAWQIPLEKMVCFIIAQNNNPANAAGLFVIFSKDQMPGILQVRHPYTMLGSKLYIPVNAELSPAISEQELQSLLIWDYQVFHPTIGFIGFERSDRIDLADLLEYREPRNIYWGYAQAGQAPWIPLRQINVQQLTTEELFESFKEHISNKPLEDIPKTAKKEVPSWLNNPIATRLFKGAFTIISGLSNLLSGGSKAGSGGGKSGQAANNDKNPGLFKKIMNWMEEKIADLEKQRDNELKRLSDLFEQNSDEALQYAIPLSSPYLNRGTAKPSAQLTKRSTQFNLGKLGGGQAVDGWDIDNYYNDLRTKYLKTAQKAIEEKDFKKAAYIYAHLLGDFTTAADTLRRGKHYREAAVLYKEHLKNASMAAICYEEGGMLPEAIELYTELNQHEKAGDLYSELGQQEPALNCYEKCVVAAAANKDYLEQSRIIIDKIADKPRAKKVLLSGWHDVKQPEACLVKYFALVADDNKEQLHSAVKAFYINNQLANKEMAFLNVIEKVNQQYKTTELENACQGIAYEIVSEQVNAGNLHSLYALKNFVPDDQLLTPDCYRFVHTFKEVPKQKPAPDQWQLASEAQWQKAFVWRNQLLVLGLRKSGLELARMNWDGYVEYFLWNELIRWSGNTFLPLADPANTNNIILYDESITEKSLPGNKYFQEELIISRPRFIRTNVVGIGFHNNEIITLHLEREKAFLNCYTVGGVLKESNRCSIHEGGAYLYSSNEPREIFFCDNHYYWAGTNAVLRMTQKGEVDLIYENGDGTIRRIAVNKKPDGFVVIAVALDEQVVIFATNDSDDFIDDPYEIKGIQVVDMTFLSDGCLALAGQKEVQVLVTLWDLEWQIETENEVIAIFPGPTRDQLGVLESNGKITLHNIKE